MKLFISYPRENRAETDQLIALLEACGHEVWIDDELRVGKGWRTQLRDAIIDYDAVVLCLTPAWIESPYCQWEFVTGVEVGKQIIPVMLIQTDLPKRISDIQYATFTNGFDNEDAKTKFCDDLHTYAQELAIQASDEATLAHATHQIEQQINQSNVQNATFGDVKEGSNVTVNQSNIGVQNVIPSEKQRDWTLPVVIGLLLALVSTVAGVIAILPEGDVPSPFDSTLVSATQTTIVDSQCDDFIQDGNDFFASRDYQDAIASFTNAIDQCSHFVSLISRGNAYLEIDEYVLAEEDYRNAVSEVDNDLIHLAFNGIGNSLREQLRRGEARTAYTNAIISNPQFSTAYYNRALLNIDERFDSSLVESAISDYCTLLSLPTATDFQIADLAERLNDPECS